MRVLVGWVVLGGLEANRYSVCEFAGIGEGGCRQGATGLSRILSRVPCNISEWLNRVYRFRQPQVNFAMGDGGFQFGGGLNGLIIL